MIINNENKKIIHFKDIYLKAKDNSSQSNEDMSSRESSEKASSYDNMVKINSQKPEIT